MSEQFIAADIPSFQFTHSYSLLHFSPYRTSGGAGSTSNNASGGVKQNSSSTSRQLARSRARIMRTTSVRNNGTGGQSASGSSSRGTGVIIGSGSSGRSLVSVPAPFVPDELVSQAQVVLQGKSRNVIIRELQVSIPYFVLNFHRPINC